jgi:hypothetical protein
MGSTMTLVVTFACTVGGALVGMLLRQLLPPHHLRDDSRDVLKLGAGVIATLTALVLGLLVGSAKSSFDSVNSLIVQIGAKTITLDRALAHYGPETKELRNQIHAALGAMVAQTWPDSLDAAPRLRVVETSTIGEDLLNRIRELKSSNAAQSAFQAQALQIGNDLQQSRWLMIEENQVGLPTALLLVLLCWLTILFATYGLLTPVNLTVVVVLVVCALSMSGAIYIVVEMVQPFDGVIKASSAPLLKALQYINR